MLDLLRERLEETAVTAARIGAPDWLVDELNTPKRRIEVQFRARVHGKLKLFSGFVVLHRNPHPTGACPYKGGLRFHKSVTPEILTVLAMEMTDKCILAGLPFGGAKAGIAFDPLLYSEEECRLITEAFTHELLTLNLPHPDIFVPGPDMGTTSREMLWMYIVIADMNQVRNIPNVPASVTGKPVHSNGIPEREDATARGALIQIKKFLELSKQRFTAPPRLVIQGFGNVGANLVRLSAEKEFGSFNCVAVSDVSGGIHNPLGLNIPALFTWYGEHKTFSGFPDATAISNEELLTLPTDILLPAATENQITEKNADNIVARIIFEVANRAITPGAEKIFWEKGVSVIPGVVANAGGVVVSFCEWSINRGMRIHEVDVFPGKSAVHTRLERIMERTLCKVVTYAEEKKCSYSCAAQDLAMLEMLTALRQKHSYPA